ncbi:hypothetical protein SUGI_0327200 [Cryptomeria japonica]|uniref:uncharacterized protein LOC131040258 n=1 Tax=Cryptomeria japonica TaxID=3369 RepID=UPI002408E922|nr:uncharacterized protein LOC131040258 [Cryptomeria japonica]GLJ18446.1 hypothetical protein SUGI_0327200 [Cryptomeria japonica]
MGKKKSFLNKKNAATFRLVCRDSSDADPFGLSGHADKVFARVDDGTNHVPGFSDDNPRPHIATDSNSIFADAEEEKDLDLEENNAKFLDRNSLSIPNPYSVEEERSGPLPDHIRREILELGLPDDGYNYLLHMREIRASGGGSSFVPNSKADLSSLPADVKAYDASKLQVQARNEVDLHSESLYTVSSRTRYVRNIKKAADPEILGHLEKSDSEVDSDEELEEDFIIQANELEEEEQGEASTRSPEIRQEDLCGTQSSSGQDKCVASSFGKRFDDAYEFPTGGAAGLVQGSEKQRTPRVLDEQFELLALREYSDGDNDGADVFDYDIMGAGDFHAPEIDSAMKEFLTNNLDYQDKYTVPADVHILSTSAENSRQNPNIPTAHDFVQFQSQDTTVNDVIRKCAEYAEMYANEPEEEKEIVLVEESSDSEVWDCETIVSTYSNLDNHPAKISAPQKPGRKDLSEISQTTTNLNGSMISLRGRQQLPVGFLPNKRGSSKGKKEEKLKSETSSKILAHARVGETPEQKKARKSAVKEEKREARRTKKELKALYRGESQRAQHVDAVAGPPAIHLM